MLNRIASPLLAFLCLAGFLIFGCMVKIKHEEKVVSGKAVLRWVFWLMEGYADGGIGEVNNCGFSTWINNTSSRYTIAADVLWTRNWETHLLVSAERLNCVALEKVLNFLGSIFSTVKWERLNVKWEIIKMGSLV